MAEPKRHDPVPLTKPAAGGIAARAMAARAGNMPFGHELNPEQRAAVETLDGPVLVLAGAGTGKTRVLTTRIAHILTLGRAHPSQILAVTFTNKAARQMKERVGTMVGHVVEGMPWMGTFHSIGVKILRRHAELVGLKSDFTILDVDDQIRLMKQLLEAEKLDEKRWPARMLAGLIDGWKNRGLTPDQVPAGEAASFANGKGKKLYQAYQERLKTLNAADFGDLLLECIRLFRTHPDVLRQYQQRFKFILVDEYQDTNVAQYLWLRLLSQSAAAPSTAVTSPQRGEVDASERSEDAAGEGVTDDRDALAPSPGALRAPPSPPRGEGKEDRKNICCVGDDDQSIYGWRGAEVDNILRFDHDFPGATVIRLERNYRSPATSSPPPRISSPTTKAGSARRCAPRTCSARRSRHRRLGLGGRSPRHRRGDRGLPARGARAAARTIRSTRSPFWCAPRSRCASSKTASSSSACPIASSAARASTSAPRSATRSPICASSRSRPTTSPSSASSTRRSAASATPPCRCCTTMRAKSAFR